MIIIIISIITGVKMCSIPTIRQRKLFPSRAPTLTDISNFPDKPSHQHCKTDTSDGRESYSSRPTLNGNSIVRKMSALETKLQNQETVAAKCFEAMEGLDQEFRSAMDRQEQVYQVKLAGMAARLQKQRDRNNQAEHKQMQLVDTIVQVLSTTQHTPTHTIKPSRTQLIPPLKLPSSAPGAFLQRVEAELSRRVQQPNNNTSQFLLYPNTSLSALELALHSQERQSQSILLDDWHASQNS